MGGEEREVEYKENKAIFPTIVREGKRRESVSLAELGSRQKINEEICGTSIIKGREGGEKGGEKEGEKGIGVRISVESFLNYL